MRYRPVWWHMPVIQAPERCNWEVQGFQASLDYMRLCLKKKGKNKTKDKAYICALADWAPDNDLSFLEERHPLFSSSASTE